MKNKLTRKLMLSAFTLLFAVISLGASTYAWFTMSNEAEVEAFTADVKAGEGIEIAVTKDVDPGNAEWYTGTVPSGVVQAAANPLTDGKTTFRFDAATTYNNAQTIVERKKSTSDVDVLSSGYVSFYVHIKAAQAGKINLSNIELACNNPYEWTVDAAYTITGTEIKVNNKIQYSVADAARVALAVKNESGFETALIYENNERDLADPVTATENGTEITKYVAGNQVGVSKTDGAYEYYNKKNIEDQLSNYAVPTYTANQVSTLSTAQLLKEVAKGEILTIKVQVWIEGWDAECLNAIFAQTKKAK